MDTIDWRVDICFLPNTIYVGSIGMFIALSLVSYGFYAEKFCLFA
jgi:hypothetical protein